MHAKLSYAIKFVTDMDAAIRFHRDVLGLPLKFQSPEWSEFATGEVTLALHLASAQNPAGHVELGFAVKNLAGVYTNRQDNELEFLSEPKPLHGSLLASIKGSEGETCSISESL
jgi:catechol 2,3-dioxygenase-like lactoylglutathione lyase family enzyme